MPTDWLDQLPETYAWPEWDRENLREKFALLGLDLERVILDTQRNRVVYELTAAIDPVANPNSPIRAALWDLVASEEKRMTLSREEREQAPGQARQS